MKNYLSNKERFQLFDKNPYFNLCSISFPHSSLQFSIKVYMIINEWIKVILFTAVPIYFNLNTAYQLIWHPYSYLSCIYLIFCQYKYLYFVTFLWKRRKLLWKLSPKFLNDFNHWKLISNLEISLMNKKKV